MEAVTRASRGSWYSGDREKMANLRASTKGTSPGYNLVLFPTKHTAHDLAWSQCSTDSHWMNAIMMTANVY